MLEVYEEKFCELVTKFKHLLRDLDTGIGKQLGGDWTGIQCQLVGSKAKVGLLVFNCELPPARCTA